MANHQSRLTRRSVLAMSWQTLVAVGVARAGGLFAFVNPAKRGLENATVESFAPHIGTTFRFLKPSAEGGFLSSTVELSLASVTRHEKITRLEACTPATYGKRKREPFSLLFELRRQEPLGAGLHEFAQGEFKGCPVFLSRVLSAGNHAPIRYEAVFG